MPGRDSIFCRDWRNQKSWRCRLLIIPAQTLGTIVLPNVGRPAWRGAIPEGSKYVRLGRYVLYGMTELESGFEDRPVGIFDAATMRVGVNVTRCEAQGGDVALLPGFLLDPAPASCQGRVYTGAAHTRFRFFPTPNTFVLLSDRGDGSLDVGDFHTEFVGVQEAKAEDQVVCRRKAQRARIECQLIDVVKYTLQNVLADDITKLFLDVHGDDSAAYKPNNAWGSTVTFYNDVWRANDINFAHCVQTFRHDNQAYTELADLGQDKCRWYRLPTYWSTVARLVDNVYHEVMKQDYTVGNRRFRFRYTGDTTIVDPTPMEHLTFLRKSYDAANTPGTALARTDVCFNGVIWWSRDGEYGDVKPIYGAGAREDKFVGGYLIDHSDEGSHHHKDIANLWDHLARSTKLLMRCAVKRIEPSRIDFWYCRLYDVVDPGSDYVRLRRKDIAKVATDDVTVLLRKDSVAGCDVAIPNGEGRDEPNVEVRDGTISEADETFTLGLHNLPKAGNESNRWQMRWQQNDLLRPQVSGAQGTFNPLQLGYAATPAGISANEIMIRPHDWVAIDLGNGSYIMDEIHSGGATLALPTVNTDQMDDEDDGELDDDEFDSLFWLPVRTRAEQAQKTSCLAWAIARRALDVFGSKKRWRIEEPVRGTLAVLDNVSAKAILAESDGTPSTLGILLDGSTMLDELPNLAICTHTKLNVNTGASEATYTGFESV